MPQHPGDVATIWSLVQLALLFLAFLYVTGHALNELKRLQKTRKKSGDPSHKDYATPRTAIVRWALQAACGGAYALYHLSEFLSHASAMQSA
jgi:hypothetical protein